MDRKTKIAHIVFILIILVLLGAIMWFLFLRPNKGSSYDKMNSDIPSSALQQIEKSDGYGSRTQLSESFLKAEYEKFYSDRHSELRFKMMTSGLLFLLIPIIMTAGSIFMIIRSETRQQRIILIVLASIIDVMFLGIYLLCANIFYKPIPDVETATYQVYPIEITGSEEISKGRNVHRSTHYVITYRNGTMEATMEVSEEVYNDVKRAGVYYLASAEEGDNRIYFAAYSASNYVR